MISVTILWTISSVIGCGISPLQKSYNSSFGQLSIILFLRDRYYVIVACFNRTSDLGAINMLKQFFIVCESVNSQPFSGNLLVSWTTYSTKGMIYMTSCGKERLAPLFFYFWLLVGGCGVGERSCVLRMNWCPLSPYGTPLLIMLNCYRNVSLNNDMILSWGR